MVRVADIVHRRAGEPLNQNEEPVVVTREPNPSKFDCLEFGYLRTLLIGGLLASLAIGCDRTGESLLKTSNSEVENSDRWVATSASPRSTIEMSVRTYRRLHTYQDAAFVRLQYTLDGKRLEDRAPLSVAWNDQGHLGLRVYSVEAGPSAGRWRLRLQDAQATVPDQVLSRSIPARVDFPWLLSDPLVAERLSAGLAGFPPQLDLLLAEQPFKGLVDDSAALSFGQPEMIDGRPCLVIRVQRGPADFTLWIDEKSLLVRRLKLPRSHLTPQMLADGRLTDVELTIEFADARGDAEINWSNYEISAEAGEMRVNRFVPDPLRVDVSGYGEQIPGFHLESPTGETVYSSSAPSSRRKATVLLWLADHPTCRIAGEQLQRVSQSLTGLGVAPGAVEFVMVWAEPAPPKDTTFADLRQDWQLPGVLALDRDAMGRDLFQVQEAPTLVVVDQNNRLQLRESRSNPILDQVLPALLRE